MNQNVPFMVATLGFEERERSMVRDLLRISEYRTPTFRALLKDSGQSPHIVLINADRPDALAKWEAYHRANAGKGRLPAVMWSRKPLAAPSPPAQAHKYTLTAPAVLSHLFTLLERVVSEEHGFRPPVATDTGQRMFVMSTEELTANQSAAELAADQPVVELTADQSAATQYIATVVIAPPPKLPAISAAVAVESATRLAAVIAAGAATATGAPPTSDATEIAVIIEPEAFTTPTSGSGTTSGISTAARGSTADIRVPRESARPRSASSAQSRFLVVDDSLPVRIQMKEALQRFAKTIDFAHDAEQAMILIDNCKYDVIFLDVILPGKDGYDVCRHIRSHPLQRQTPVIMLTGNSAPADRVKGKLAGCDTYLIKPVRQSVLAEVIGEFVKSSAVA
jgi:CheY-like chemotaxis protein